MGAAVDVPAICVMGLFAITHDGVEIHVVEGYVGTTDDEVVPKGRLVLLDVFNEDIL